MAITKTEVFISSNFDEFNDLRANLRQLINYYRGFPMQAVDLNENRASANPPLEKSIQAVKHSEVMVLLIGEKYGGIPPNEELSYTHIEYHTAFESDYKTVILPYCIGNSYKNGLKQFSNNSKLAAWQREVQENHTIGFFADETDVTEIASLISQEVQKVIYDSLSDSEQAQVDAEDISDEDLGALDLSILPSEELEYLEKRSGVDVSLLAQEEELKNEMDVLSSPAKAAALEQRKEAVRAIQLGERLIAMKHLRRALEHRPLDIEVNYWLSRLLVATGRRKESQEAIQLALLAAKLANREGSDVRAAVAYVLAAQGASKAEDFDAGLNYAKQAYSKAPWLALTHIELACQYVQKGLLKEAFQAAEDAFYRHPFSILKLNREPSFQRFSYEFKDFKRKLRKKVSVWVKELLNSAFQAQLELNSEISKKDNKNELNVLLSKANSMSLMELVRIGRNYSKQYLEFLQLRLQDTRAQKERANSAHSLGKKAEEKEVPTPKINFVYYFGAGGIVMCILLSSFIPVLILALALVGISIDIYKFLENKKLHKQRVDELAEDWKLEVKNYQKKINAFERSVVDFENTAVKQVIFSPSVGLKNAQLHSLIRIDSKGLERSANFVVDSHILPPELKKDVTMPVKSNPRYKLYRVIGESDSKLIAARWACYDNYKVNDPRYLACGQETLEENFDDEDIL